MCAIHPEQVFLTHGTGEDEAEGIGDTSVVMLVFIAVDDKRAWR